MSAATSLDNSYEGLAPFNYAAANRPLQTYYRVYGDLKSSRTPLICIHGGPGFCHNYLLNHSYLTESSGVPVVFYDQIGSGRSTHLPETANVNDFWTIEIFLEQLRQLIKFLRIDGRFDVLGSSWGGMMGSEFASTRPLGLRRLILANAAASKALSLANSNTYRKNLSQESQHAIDEAEEMGNFQNPEFHKAMLEFNNKHVCTVSPIPEDLLASIKASNEDRTVIAAMTRGDEANENPFKSSGFMGRWSIVGRAKDINVRTLLINGIEEYASGDAVKPFLQEIPDVRLATLKGTSHSPHLEDKGAYFKAVRDFLEAP